MPPVPVPSALKTGQCVRAGVVPWCVIQSAAHMPRASDRAHGVQGTDYHDPPPLPVQLLREHAARGQLVVCGHSLGAMAALGAVMTASLQEGQQGASAQIALDDAAATGAESDCEGGGSESPVGETQSGAALVCGSTPGSAPELARDAARTRDDAWPADDESVGSGWECSDLGEGGVHAEADAGQRWGALEGLEHVVLLSPATMMWPLWYQSLLPSDWWTHPPSWSRKVETWVVKGDPLAESLPGGALKAPQIPGKTQVLPSRVRPRCPHVHENQAFVNFVSHSYETEAS
eukprot:Tamp_11591.p2 GENE.Tamp_11591~~Tamp_11591.p2  ORF type:complete len:290 (-),score=37.97 Tamp_11591:186-1055(-)